MTSTPFALPAAIRTSLDTIFPPGMPVMEVARTAPDRGFTIAGTGPDHLVMRHDSRAYVRLGLSAAGAVRDRALLEGEDAAELDRRLWFTFRGLRDKVVAELRIGAPAREVIAALRALAPIGLDHLSSVYRSDLGSVRLYHLVGGGVIGLEVDPLGVVTGANPLPPKVGQATVIALEAQDREAELAAEEPRRVASLRDALDDVVRRRAEIVGVKELDPTGATIEITGRTGDGARRYRYVLDGSGPQWESREVTEHFAYGFECDLNLGELRAKLNAVGPWEWVVADSDSLGDYLACTPIQNARRSLVKILIDPDRGRPHYAVNVLVKSDRPEAATQVAELRETLFQRLLPAIGARGVAETDTYE